MKTESAAFAETLETPQILYGLFPKAQPTHRFILHAYERMDSADILNNVQCAKFVNLISVLCS
jgi:hypothetical protein